VGQGGGLVLVLAATRASGDCVEHKGRPPTRTSTRPPHPLHPAPCPYRTLGRKQREPVGTAWSNQVAPQRGQAPGPLIHSTPPLVPTGPWAASTSMDRIPRFGRQHSSGVRIISSMCISSITCRYKPHPSNSTGIPRNYPFLIPQRPVMTTGDSTDALQALAGYTLSKGSSMGARPC